jgi:beta-1,2-mannobiose phosphorylase / 1,2-beta-oligomannan phosphorylase
MKNAKTKQSKRKTGSARTAVRAPLKKRTKKVSPRSVLRKTGQVILEKFEGNPIILPDEKREWESKATFNPGAMYEGGKVHLLYRAIGDSDVSVLGYASTKNGVRIDERFPSPAYAQRGTPEDATGAGRLPISYSSGGGWGGGCEDPRLTVIDQTVYLFYTAFDGWSSLRVAFTSIPLEDFRNKKWNWREPVFISPPGEIHKNWVLFPEKINGKYAVLHSISPKILIDYVDSLDDFRDGRHIKSHHGEVLEKRRWDSLVRGVGPPPIKTKDGWLVLYHAVDHRDPGRYKLGAMLLDFADPTKILNRSKQPLLEPDEFYENEGFKAGIVYSCGAVVVGGQLFVYYGGSDTFVCVASANLNEFLRELKGGGAPKVKKFSAMRAA